VYGRGPSNGVVGRSTNGVGVRGESTTGLAGQFAGKTVVEGDLEATTAKVSGKSTLADVDASGPVKLAGTLDAKGKATLASLDVSGPVNVDRLSLPKTSGVVTLKRAAASISVANVPVGAASLAIATLQRHRKGLYVVAAVPNASRNRITIHFNKRAPKGTKVAWMVVN
jgi:hypothetical protein